MHFHFPGTAGKGVSLSSGESFSSTETRTAAFTCFFLQASNSPPPTEESPSARGTSRPHTNSGRHGTYMTPTSSPGDWAVPRVSQTSCNARIPREAPSLYIASCSDTERS